MSAAYGAGLPTRVWGKGVNRIVPKAVAHTGIAHHALHDALHQAEMHRWLLTHPDSLRLA
jgi:hypothetical protein